MPVAHDVTATMRAGRPSTVRPSAAAAVRQRRRRRRAAAAAAAAAAASGIPLADRVAHDRDDVVVRLRGAQAAREVVLHEAARELRQHREVRLGGTLGRRDEEDEVGGAVGGAEVDAGLQPREGERRLGDGGALGVRDRDAAGEAGLVLLLARPRVGEERLRRRSRDPAATTRAASDRMTAALSAPRPTSRLTSSGVMVWDTMTSNGRWCGGRVDGRVGRVVRRDDRHVAGGRSCGVGACVPGRDAAAAP